MKVLRLSPHYYFESKDWPSEYDPLGGMQTQITHLTEKLAERKISQIVITSGYPGADPINQEYLKVIPVSHFFIRIKSKIDGLVGFNMFWVLGVRKWLRKNKEKMKEIDIVHLHYSGVYAPILVSMIMKKKYSIDQVITIHCSRNFTFIPPNLNSRFFNKFIKKMEIKTINAAKKVIVLTEKQKENYTSIGIPTDKIEVIGDGPQKEMLLNVIKEKNLEEKFIVTGFISRLKIPYILKHTDVLLVPSRHEEFGGVVIEGVAANLPIVTTGVGGIKGILGRGYNGIVGDDITRFAMMINKYLDGVMVPNYNRDEIISRYNHVSSINRLCKIYEE